MQQSLAPAPNFDPFDLAQVSQMTGAPVAQPDNPNPYSAQFWSRIACHIESLPMGFGIAFMDPQQVGLLDPIYFLSLPGGCIICPGQTGFPLR